LCCGRSLPNFWSVGANFAIIFCYNFWKLLLFASLLLLFLHKWYHYNLIMIIGSFIFFCCCYILSYHLLIFRINWNLPHFFAEKPILMSTSCIIFYIRLYQLIIRPPVNNWYSGITWAYAPALVGYITWSYAPALVGYITWSYAPALVVDLRQYQRPPTYVQGKTLEKQPTVFKPRKNTCKISERDF
jgi:vacuolar-type H+-ATPase subunit I/STV1